MRKEDAIEVLKIKKLDKDNVLSSYNKRVLELENENGLDPIQKLMKKNKLEEAKNFLLKSNLTGEEVVIVEYDHEKGKSFELSTRIEEDSDFVNNYIDLKAEELYKKYIGTGPKVNEDNPVMKQINKFIESCEYANNEMDRIDELYNSFEQKIVYILDSYIESVLTGEIVPHFESDGVYHTATIDISASDGWNTINKKLSLVSKESKIKEVVNPTLDKINDLYEVAGDVKNMTLKGIKDLFKKRK